MSGTWIWLPPSGGTGLYWADPVATTGDLPVSSTAGEVRLVEGSSALYWWNGSAWTQLTVAPGAININTDTTGTLLIARGGTNSTAALSNGRIMASAAGAIVENVATLDTSGNMAALLTVEVRNDTDLSSAAQPMLRLENRNDTVTSNPHLEYRRARASNANLANGDWVGGQDYHPRFNSSSSVAARLYVEYTGNGTTRLADFVWQTSNAAAPAERMRLTAAGLLNITGLTASRALVTDGSKNLASSATTATEIGYVSGVTSAIQTQLDAKAPTASPTFTGTVTMSGGGLRLANLTTAQRDALTAAAGMMIFNTDTNRFQGYFSGAWGDLHGWGS